MEVGATATLSWNVLADRYVSVAELRIYHLARGRDLAEYTEAQLAVSTIHATDYIDRRWGTRFMGVRRVAGQFLAFPRSGLRDARGDVVEGIPLLLRYAAAEYALRALDADLWPDPEAREHLITARSEQLGPLSESTSYAVFDSKMELIPPYPMADRMLLEYLRSAGTVVR